MIPWETVTPSRLLMQHQVTLNIVMHAPDFGGKP